MAEENKQREALFAACDSGSLEEIRKLLASGIDVNLKDRFSNTALFHCKSSGVARALLANGAQVSALNDKAETPLHAAAARGNKEMVLFLVLNGVELGASNVDGKKAADLNPATLPLIYAIEQEKDTYASLTEPQIKRLAQIFEEVDIDKVGYWNLDKSTRFNRYLEDIDAEVARKDAQDFLRDVSICQPGQVNQEEWVLTFAKLAKEQGGSAVDTFLDEYDRVARDKGKYEEFANPRF